MQKNPLYIKISPTRNNLKFFVNTNNIIHRFNLKIAGLPLIKYDNVYGAK